MRIEELQKIDFESIKEKTETELGIKLNWCVFDRQRNGDGDIFSTNVKSGIKGLEEAEFQLLHMTTSEKKKRVILLVLVDSAAQENDNGDWYDSFLVEL